MSQSHLTHKYRPQTFAEVAGQQTIKAILSRAAQTGAVAPAYMFSGTRGVGKTTIARIFAKAINCEKGPAAEPCNECRHCKQIQAGACVDVSEIDGASNTGVDNVRSLKEDVGFAPIDCRYKVFIIDEAHMLSKGAFNALLKTLEEPPSHVTFIMATTEPHKFPATIISRCQHYTFQRVIQKELEDHLRFVLKGEGLGADDDAVALIARRGAGSVRDSMSLMGQVLALGSEGLSAADVRQVLGLAGRDIMFRLLEALHGRDGVGVSVILREILDQGLDLGFFLRELTECWRNMFLLAQAGDAAAQVIDAPDEEVAVLRGWAEKFGVAVIHAAWQMTLEGQQRVRSSLEPALALELLLLNLAYLPQLLCLEDITTTGAMPSAPAAPAAPAAPSAPPASGGPPPRPKSGSEPSAAPRASAVTPDEAPRTKAPAPSGDSAGHGVSVPDGERNWDGFLSYARAVQDASGQSINGVMQARATYADGELTVSCRSKTHSEQLRRGEAYQTLTQLVGEYFGPGTGIGFQVPERQFVDPNELRDSATKDPTVGAVLESFDGRILDVRPAGNK